MCIRDRHNAAKQGSVSSSTRGVTGTGISPGVTTKMQYVTISSQGGGSTFGDLSFGRQHPYAASNNTRGIFAAGYSPISFNTIEYITIASTGNATDFGDSTRIVAFNNAGLSDCHGGLG